jgi:hypothetical protein
MKKCRTFGSKGFSRPWDLTITSETVAAAPVQPSRLYSFIVNLCRLCAAWMDGSAFFRGIERREGIWVDDG